MRRIALFSFGLTRLGVLETLLGYKTTWRPRRCVNILAVACWGRKDTSTKAIEFARSKNLPCWFLEDGFLRSFGTGDDFPPLALVVDELGIYYDSTCSSGLEALLASDQDVLDGLAGKVGRARALILEHCLSKYNHAGDSGCSPSDWRGLPLFARRAEAPSVLVIDQTAGDVSVALGGANAQTFADMLAAARAENPQATIYVKTHPEVSAGRKGGYLTNVQDGLSPSGQRTVVLRGLLNPLELIEQMDRVYVVSSTMGFEALLAGKPVVCFGVPWYAGWGVTDDRCTQTTAWARRTRKRTVEELFAAAYFHYTRYLNPLTHERGTIFDVIHWLINQKRMVLATQGARGRTLAVGFRRWKAAHLKPMLGLDGSRVHFVATARAAQRMGPGPQDRLVFWGRTPPPELEALALKSHAKLVRLEDGFVRSVGLGSDLVRPHSLVMDATGLYFDPTQPSDLEHLLSTRVFTADDANRAAAVRQFIVRHGITKYNLESREIACWPVGAGQRVVLVPGQVEDDASIRFGCTDVRSNLALLKAARGACPDAFIVYKPHPDVMSGNRRGRVGVAEASVWADWVETGLSVVSCLDACDEVHTMTSLAGFEALLRGKQVITYGQPFYAGWGLTQDRAGAGGASTPAFSRRRRRLELDELVAGTLLHYPLYWDWRLKGFTTCEAVLNTLLAAREAAEKGPGLEHLRSGWLRRQARKLRALWEAWTHAL